MLDEIYVANPNHNPTLKEAITALKMSNTAKTINKTMKHLFHEPIFFECPQNKINDYIESATFEGADIITKDGEIVVANYIDDVNHIIYVVLTHFKRAFVMELRFKE